MPLSKMAVCKLSRYVYLFLLVGAVDKSTASSCEKIDDCSCRKSNGKILNLKPVDAKPGPRFSGIKETLNGKVQEGYTLSWNPCTKFSKPGCKDVLVCQNAGDNIPVAKTVSSFTENSNGSITMRYSVVKDSKKNYERTAVFLLKCDPDQDPGTPTQFIERKITSPEGSVYTSTFASKYVCEESEGLSAGSILLIVFFPLLLLYLIAGVLYNKCHKGVNSFPEIIPNHSFWADFPVLVKDGCVFTFQGIAGCCKRLCMKLKGDSYAEI